MTTFVDMTAPEFFADPYPIYKELRQSHPIAATAQGGVLLTRHRDILAALRDPMLGNAPSRFATLNARNREKYVAADLANNILPFLDPPDHSAIRATVVRAFRERIQGFEAELSDVAEESFNPYIAQESFDLIESAAPAYAVRVMCRFLGLLEDDVLSLKVYSEAFFRLFAPITDLDLFQETNRHLDGFRTLIADCFRQRKAQPRDDFISYMLRLGDGGSSTPQSVLVDNTILVFADGIENIEAGIANILIALANSNQLEIAALADPIELDRFVLEAIRLETPGQIIPRIARQDLIFQGHPLKANEPVFLALGSANRDCDLFVEPERLDINRPRTSILTFGKGRHHCVGAGLAQMQFKAAVGHLLKTGIRLDLQQPPTYQARLGHRWPQSLQLTHQ